MRVCVCVCVRVCVCVWHVYTCTVHVLYLHLMYIDWMHNTCIYIVHCRWTGVTIAMRSVGMYILGSYDVQKLKQLYNSVWFRGGEVTL